MTAPYRAAARSRRTRGMALAIALVVAGCSSGGDGAGATSADDARQLNEAAAMLDANGVDANAAAADEGTAR